MWFGSQYFPDVLQDWCNVARPSIISRFGLAEFLEKRIREKGPAYLMVRLSPDPRLELDEMRGEKLLADYVVETVATHSAFCISTVLLYFDCASVFRLCYSAPVADLREGR